MKSGFKQGLIGGSIFSLSVFFTGIGMFLGVILGASACYLASKTSGDVIQGGIAGLIVASAGGVAAAVSYTTLTGDPTLTQRLTTGAIHFGTAAFGCLIGLGVDHLKN